MKVWVQIIILAFILNLCQCKKVIQVNLNDTAPQLVIIGEVTSNPGPYTVSLSETVNFSADNVFPPVSGAFITIKDSTKGLTDTLTEVTAGHYTTHILSGIPGDAYLLTVAVSGKIYSALSVMPQPVTLDSVTFIENGAFGTNLINPVVNFQDPAGIPNYYEFTETVNSRLINNIFIFDDRLSDGKYIRQPLFNDSAYIQTGNELVIGMYGIDENVFNYFNELQNATGNSFQTLAPANPSTNISNGALGYFSAHTVDDREIIAY
jgi:hypothetical protein